MQWKRSILLVCGLAAAANLWARKPGDTLKPGYNLFSKYHDIQVGQAAAAEVRQHYQVVPDQFLQDYVRRCGERLAATPEARLSGFQFNFTVLNVPQVNAFALPGGPMFIFTGLFGPAENEAQLMGVMAHEMSHVILRHGTHEASKRLGVQVIGNLLGAAAAASNPGAAELSRLGLGLGANSLILHFSREAESEADALGSHMMAEAGYNPIEMARFFEKLASQGNRGLQFFSDHPNPENRERAIEAEIRALPKRDYGFETGDFPRAKSEVAAIPPPGTAPGPGATFGGGPAGPSVTPLPAPSVSWRLLRAPAFMIGFPANWAAEANAESTQWMIGPPEAPIRGTSPSARLAYGAEAGQFVPSVSRASLETATLELISRLNVGHPGVQLNPAPPKTLRIDGSEAELTLFVSQSPTGGNESDALLTVSRGSGFFYLLCLAPERNFPQLQGTFQQMINSIRFGN